MKFKHKFLTALIGLVTSGWGAGIISVHYMIGNSSPLNSINAIGLIIAVVGLGITIGSFAALKGQWSFEVVEDELI